MNKMKKEMKKKNPRSIDDLPVELFHEILLKLPVRSLLRLKCVSKSWHSQISNPQFARSHFDLDASPTHRLLLLPDGIMTNAEFQVESFDVEAPFHHLTGSAMVNLKFPPHKFKFPLYGFFLSLGSCRGFLLLTKMMGPSAGELILWNPSTSAHKVFPLTYLGNLFNFLRGFGYDQSKDDYVFVLIRLGNDCQARPARGSLGFCFRYDAHEMKSQIEVLSLKTNVPSFYFDPIEYVEAGPGYESRWGVFLEKSLHWLVKSKATQVHVVIALDLVERSLSEIPLLPELAAELVTYRRACLRVLGGCLSVCYANGGDRHEEAEIWVMKEYKVQSSWTKSFDLIYHHHLVHDIGFFPLFFTEDGGVFGSDEGGKFRKFHDEGDQTETYRYGLRDDRAALQFFNIYRESLLTLPGEPSNPA